MERFLSKRNQVFMIDGVVCKRCNDRKSAVIEADILRVYYDAGICVPKVLEQKDAEITMEYISGETIPDFLHRMEALPDEAELQNAVYGLVNWFVQFYKAVDHVKSGEIRGDVNGRNFIIAPKRVVSVDFEERVYGEAEQDIGRLLAFIRTYDLEGTTAKCRFARLFGQEAEQRLRLSAAKIVREFKLEIAAMKKRRSQI